MVINYNGPSAPGIQSTKAEALTQGDRTNDRRNKKKNWSCLFMKKGHS